MVENSSYSYPVVLYPANICSILNSYPPISEIFDELPQPPIITRKKFFMFLLVIAIIITLIGGFSLLIWSILLYIIYIIIGGIIGIPIILHYDLNENIFYQYKYDTNQFFLLKHLIFILPYTPLIAFSFDKEYKFKLNQCKENYYKIIEEYKSKTDQNYIYLNHFEKKIWNYRTKKIKSILNVAKKPKKKNVNPRRGYLEAYFYDYLKSFFGENIKVNWQLKKPEFDYPYTPDYIYQDLNWNLYIDIEVDEPYVKHSKKPIHFNDSTRNDFFLDSNWIVIRFAEEQVCRSPYSCCKHICEVISTITGETIPQSLSEVSNLEPIPRWNYTEAEKMAEKDYRESYLNEF